MCRRLQRQSAAGAINPKDNNEIGKDKYYNTSAANNANGDKLNASNIITQVKTNNKGPVTPNTDLLNPCLT